MESTAHRAIAIVGAGAVLPEAPNLAAFWDNVKKGRYCITEVTPDRWDPERYYDPDPAAPDKTYSKIGGWVRDFTWDPMKWKMPIPPRVAAAMDDAQRWGIACTREALEDYGYPKRPLDPERTAVILGNAMAGEKHYLTSLRVFFPEYAYELAETPGFAALPETVRDEITKEFHARIGKRLPQITEDSMPGELANCIAGRIANLYNFHGPNFVTDAACASAMAAITAACEGLIEHDFDYAVTGGIDRNMGAPTFVKFCKIGALSPTGSRPYAEGADGFVMGEGAVIFLLKRLADAERDGDRIYAVIRGIAGASDGKGKGITAPNPTGQRICVERAWQNAGLSPATVSLIEGHGTSTKVGDVVEVQSITDVLKSCDVPHGTVALGSVKSNIGHLKGAAGSAGLLKATLALHEKVLPPSVKFERPNPDIDFAHSPLRVNTELKPWEVPSDSPRRAGVSAFGFGGTNFHAVLEEYVPGRLNGNGKRSNTVSVPTALTHEGTMTAKEAPGTSASSSSFSSSSQQSSTSVAPPPSVNNSDSSNPYKAPLRGALVVGAVSQDAVIERLRAVHKAATEGYAPTPTTPADSDLRAPERIAIDYGTAAELAEKCSKALKAFALNQPLAWKALRAQGVFRGQGPAPKVAFLYTGQGSQYVNMMKSLRAIEPIVAETFTEADRALTSLLGKPLSEFIFVDKEDPAAIEKAEEDLRQTAITQPAVLATDISMTRLLAAYGIRPAMTMGHSLGEYGALVAAGALPFEDALEAVSARGREMTRVSMADNGRMAAVLAPLSEIERIVKTVNGYLVIANINSERQAVIGGASKAVEEAVELFVKAGYTAIPLPVSHAFHTSIVAPASEPLRKMLQRLRLRPPQLPIVANVDGEFYPMGPDVVPQMLDILAQQVAAPVQFVKGLRTLYDAGARVFVETGPKKALHGFVEDVLGERGDVLALFTNHPKLEDTVAFNQALCGLYAAGLGRGISKSAEQEVVSRSPEKRPEIATPVASTQSATVQPTAATPTNAPSAVPQNDDHYVELGRLFAEAIERGSQIMGRQWQASKAEPVVITGAALGLPGTEHIFDESNVARILRGEQFIGLVPQELREAMLDKNITRLVKSDNGGPVFESISDVADVIKLAGRGATFNLGSEFGLPAERTAALDRVTALAIASGIDALRDAGIPLVMRYKTTTKGTRLPDRWGLPEAMRDDTGVIFASAFPGYDAFADEMKRHYTDLERRHHLAMLEKVRAQASQKKADASLLDDLDSRIKALHAAIEKDPYVLDRRFLFRVLSMGHSQFAEYIGARGPNTQLNSACATTTQGIAVAEDWIAAGRCRRVIILSADDVTSDRLFEWIGAGFLASGAAATDEVVEDAAIPFDKRRHGMIVGMGAAAMIVESAEAARERGVQPICEVLSTVTANSAFHGSRLDVQHISGVMETLVQQAESRFGIDREHIAPHAMFMSHETYTPARGGSASAEIFALRKVFGDDADKLVIANTKGYTGHAMATGIEDVVAIKALETGIIPPVANFKEVDPELGQLNLSKGGPYPVEYAIRLGAGFGSQISMVILRWVKTKDAVRRQPAELGYAYRIVNPAAWSAWVTRMSGNTSPELEVVQHTLRVHDEAAARMNETVPEPKAMAARASAGAAPATKAEPVFVVPSEEKPEVAHTMAAPAAASSAVPALVTAAPVAVPVPETKTSLTAAVDHGYIKDKVLTLVSEKTGYPIDMLDLDLDLEADLGIDTVKQAEVFATIREAYGIARDDKIRLRDFPTLAHVIRFVEERLPKVESQASPIIETTPEPKPEVKPELKKEVQPEPTVTPVTAASAATTAPAETVAVKERILTLVVEKTGYPKDMLDLDLDLEADLGVDTVKQAEMFAAIREIYDIPRDPNLKLRDFPTLAHVIRFVFDKRPDLAQTATAHAPVEVTPATPPPVSNPEPAVGGTAHPATPIAPAQPATSAAPLGAEPTDDEAVKDRILTLVVEKTGYPKDMLDLDLDLEADLGVDTVKQAEMFAAIREIYSIPRDPNLKLRDFPTLAHVIKFVYDRRPDLGTRAEGAGGEPVAAAPTTQVETTREQPQTRPAPPVSTVVADEVKERVLALVVEKTGYPKDMLDLELDLEADLGVDTVKQAEMFAAIRESYDIPRDPNLKLRDFPTLAHVIKFVYDRRPDLAGTSVPAPTTVETAAPAEQAIVDRPFTPTATTEAEASTPAIVAVTPIGEDEIKTRVLDIVAAKTGYPKDMLDLELDLEADLGVDTVKQAEMFAEVRAAYNIPRDPDLKLRDFPTLAHVIQFAKDKLQTVGSEVIQPSTASASPARPAAVTQEREQTRPKVARTNVASFDAANRIPRRIPVPVPRPPLTACKATGVTLDSAKRVVIMSDTAGIARILAEHLRTKSVDILLIENTSAPEAVLERLKTFLSAGPVHGIYWLPALDDEGNIQSMDIAAWKAAINLRLKMLYASMRLLYEQVAAPGTFLISAVRLGGQHGYDEHGAVAPLGGAVVGFTKTYKRERPDALVKAVDFGADAKAEQIADLLIAETLRDPGAVEIGYQGGQRWTVGLRELPASDGQSGLVLDENSVVVVTGAAGSIVSAITADLATASGGTFYLLDLVPEPDPNNPDLERFVEDKDGLKRELFTRIQTRGERATPALVEKELAALERAHAANSAIQAVRAAGGTAHYISVNLTDNEAVEKAITQVRERSGRIDVLLHAAGMERSHFLPDKPQNEFDLIFDVKSDGWFNLLHAVGDMPLGATVAFSSIAGRFGNAGQTDYSSANDLLCKITSSFRNTRPNTRGIVIDWTAWGGIGMATRGSIPKMMEVAGIDMLPPEAGIPLIRRELTMGATRGEVVIGQRLGVLLNEFDETGGLDTAVATGHGPMVGRVLAAGVHSGVKVEVTLDPKVQPFLYDHQIEGTPVLPGVMGIEAFAEAAVCMFPGWHVEAVQDVNFLAPFKFYRNEPRTVTIHVRPFAAGETIVAECQLIGKRQLPNQKEPQTTVHFTGRVRLTREKPETVSGSIPRAAITSVIKPQDIYRIYFHGPAYQVIERAWRDGNKVLGKMADNLPPNHQPAELQTSMAPRLIELCFQTAGLWELGVEGRFGLPRALESVRLMGDPATAKGALYAIVTPIPDKDAFDAEVVDDSGISYVRLAAYRTVALPSVVDTEPLKALRAAA